MSTPPSTYSATAQEVVQEERKEDGTKVTEVTDGTTEAPAAAEQVLDSNETVKESNPQSVEEDRKDQEPEHDPAQKSKSESPDGQASSQGDRESSSPSPSSSDRDESAEPGEIDESAPPLPAEPLPDQTDNGESSSSTPPLPAEPAPEPEDDGWEYHWNPNDSSYWFYNRFTGVWQKENPRISTATAAAAVVAPVVVPSNVEPTTISNPISVAGGYNPAIHGDYDENAWYAVNARAAAEAAAAATNPLVGLDPTAAGAELASAGYFNRATGQWQAPDQNVERHSDEAKSKRQLNAYFDVDAAANMHDGRSLKAERSGKKPSRAELKAFKEKRRAKKEEKRRAWLRD
ncbi:hypothetical protein N0V85_003245 [Neurospora sp. IMI 360204]|nr:hypothetical protein N0V85_003245 [Neurospora sp. IMI 360204]